jgi:hypothetical protein
MRTPGFASEPLPAPKVGDLHQKRVRGFPALGRRHKKSQLSEVVDPTAADAGIELAVSPGQGSVGVPEGA